MGPPGVGKGTQAILLRERLGVPHVSTGDILRASMQAGASLGKQVRGFVEGGQLVPDDLMGDLIAERLQRSDARGGFILDGFPRTVGQVRTLDEVLARAGMPLDHVLMLVAPEEEIIRRLSGRRTCPQCGAVYHLESRRPESAGICDACGVALAQRPDDAEEVIRKRLGIYRAQTMAAGQVYRERGVLREVDGVGDVQQVAARLRSGLGMA